MTSADPRIVMMGVSGSGKSTIGSVLAGRLGIAFIEGDDLHSPANRTKMQSGVPLADDDRWGWLELVGSALASAPGGAVASCSALKRSYRDRLRATCPGAWFVQLDSSKSLAAERLGSRTGHFMPPALLDSQFGILERLEDDEPGISVDSSGSPDDIVRTIIDLKGEL